jgi:hypothetical protein
MSPGGTCWFEYVSKEDIPHVCTVSGGPRSSIPMFFFSLCGCAGVLAMDF